MTPASLASAATTTVETLALALHAERTRLGAEALARACAWQAMAVIAAAALPVRLEHHTRPVLGMGRALLAPTATTTAEALALALHAEITRLGAVALARACAWRAMAVIAAAALPVRLEHHTRPVLGMKGARIVPTTQCAPPPVQPLHSVTRATMAMAEHL